MTIEQIWQTLIAAALGGLFTLDTVAMGQFYLSSPLVACTILGWALGNPILGLLIGMVLTLPWLGTLPVGGYTPPDSPTAALTITLGSILATNAYPQLTNGAVTALLLLLAPFWATLAGCADDFIYRRNVNTVSRREQDYIKGDNCSPVKAIFGGLVRFFLKGFIIIAVGGWISYGLVALVNLWLGDVFNCLGFLFYAWLGLGIGVLIASFRGWQVPVAAMAGLALSLGVMVLSGRMLW